jgi:molybdate transport system ATP-binding protein
MAKDEILPYIESLNDALSLPILYVSHDIGEIARLADRVVLIASGRAVAVGPVQEIFERLDLRPVTGRFEAGVVLTTHVIRHDPVFCLTHLDHNGQTISIPAIDVGIGETIRIRIRARDVALTTRKPDSISIRNVLYGTIAEIAEDRETAFAEVLVDIGGAGLRARLTREAMADLALETGAPVYALVKSVSFDGRSIGGAPATPRVSSRRQRRSRD